MPIASYRSNVKTSGDTWATAVTGPATIAGLTVANPGLSEAVVSVQVLRGTDATTIVPGDILDAGGSARLRLGAFVLEEDDLLQVKSTGGAHWTVSYSVLS